MSKTIKLIKEEKALVPMTEKQQEAQNLHYHIMSSAQVAASAMVDFCRYLKQMRDDALYIELGHTSFDEYVEADVGMKSRQAYNYIRVYEQLPQDMIASGIGIKKLELLTGVPALVRENFVEENDISGMTVSELKEEIKKVNGINEQLTLKLDEWENSQQEDDALQREQEARIKAEEELEALKAAQAGPAVDEKKLRAEMEKEKKQAVKEAEAAAKSKAEQTHAKEIEKAKAEAKKEAEAEAAKKAEAEMAKAKAEKEAADKRAEALQKKLELEKSEESKKFAFQFEELQGKYNILLEIVNSLEEKGRKEEAEKLQGALKSILTKMLEELPKEKK